MGRKTVEINPICGKRVKQICEEQNITQKMLAKKIFLSEKTVSHMINGTSSVTRQTADAIHDLYPEYMTSWILGLSDIKNNSELFTSILTQAQEEAKLLDDGLFSFVKLIGYEVKPTDPAQDKNDIPSVINAIKAGYTFTKDGESVQMSLTELNDFENEIADYIELRLRHIMKKQNTKTEL